jgi:hypothetical protein
MLNWMSRESPHAMPILSCSEGQQESPARKKEDFVKVLLRRKDYFKSLGLVSSKLERLEASTLDSRYAIMKVVWRIRIERSGTKPIESDNSAMYILSVTNDRLEIVFQIDNQDLAKKVE